MSTVLERLSTALSDRYRLDRELGAGGMATVYLAHDLKHDRDVAIKVLHPDLGAALGGERFLIEIRTTARLQHPHILPLLDSGEADGLLYYVMPLVTGETLRARLERERQLPIADAVRIAREVASALDYAHRQNVIHRDIKPENILLHDGQAIVADFGIALAVQSAGGARMTQTGLSLGTPQYMSPEQAMGERSVDARSDVYALAAVTYEMLAGDPPFTGSTMQAVVAKVISADPERLTLTRKTIPLAIERAVLTSLAKLPADRHESAVAFGAALRDAAPDTRSSDRTGGSTTGAPVASRGTRWRVAAAGVALGVALGMAVMAAVLWPRGAARTADTNFTRTQVTFTGRAAFPALSPSGDVLAYVERDCEQLGHGKYGEYDGVPCTASLIVQDSGSSTPVRIVERVLAIRGVRWLSSGTALVIDATLDSTRSGLFVVPRLGGTLRRVGDAGVFDVHALADSILLIPASPTGARYARVIVAATGATVDSVAMPGRSLYAASWSPDGRFIALSDNRQIRLQLREGTAVDSLPLDVRPSLRWAPDGSALFMFKRAPARDDDFHRLEVDKSGRLGRASRSVMSVSVLYRGEFDIAARSGRLALVAGNGQQDLMVFNTSPSSEPARQVTSGTSWYGTPAIAPDGNALYFLRGDAAGDNLYRLALDSAPAAEDAVTDSRGSGSNGIGISSSGRRLLFGRTENDSMMVTDVDIRERRTQRRLSFSPVDVLLPRGDEEIVRLAANGTGLSILNGQSGRSRELAAPDSLRLLTAALSPDENDAVVMVSAPTGAIIGVVSLDAWRFRPLARFPRRAWLTGLTWARDGFVYFAEWSTTESAPVLRRVSAATGGPPQRVMALPARCNVAKVVVAIGAPRGVCDFGDFRGDVYLGTVPGLGR